MSERGQASAFCVGGTHKKTPKTRRIARAASHVDATHHRSNQARCLYNRVGALHEHTRTTHTTHMNSLGSLRAESLKLLRELLRLTRELPQ